MNVAQPIPAGRPPRVRYLPFGELRAGMTLAEGVKLTERNVVRFSLAAGTVLNDDHLRQLAIHRAEFVSIALPDLRCDEEVACDAAAAAARVADIFEGADLSNPEMAALFDRVLAFRSR